MLGFRSGNRWIAIRCVGLEPVRRIGKYRRRSAFSIRPSKRRRTTIDAKRVFFSVTGISRHTLLLGFRTVRPATSPAISALRDPSISSSPPNVFHFKHSPPPRPARRSFTLRRARRSLSLPSARLMGTCPIRVYITVTMNIIVIAGRPPGINRQCTGVRQLSFSGGQQACQSRPATCGVGSVRGRRSYVYRSVVFR